MRIDEAIKLAFEGKKVRHSEWIESKYFYYDEDDNMMFNENDESFFLAVDDANIDGWELYTPKHGIYQSGNVLVFYNGNFQYFKTSQWEWVDVEMSISELDGYELIEETEWIADFKVGLKLIHVEVEV